MAKKRSNRNVSKMQPAITDLFFTVPAGGKVSGESIAYIDTARELSKINRRLYSQSRMYGFQGLTFIWRATAAVGDPAQTLTTIEATVKTAGNTWSVQNAHTKGEALWHQMQELVLEDNPSIAGKWHDFKVRLDYTMTTGRLLKCQDGAGVDILDGEWDYSTYVMPQHEVDPVTGLPLEANSFGVSLIGIDVTLAGPPVTGNRSLVKAYQESRATVQPEDPNVPAGMETSFFNLLTDSGSQEPELAIVIQDEGDRPPYDDDEYVGAAVNGNVPMIASYGAISQSEVDGRLGGFVAPCGLLQIEIKGFDQNGAPFPAASMPAIDLLLHVAPGSYKGVAAISMGQ
jgi:hypothetical protein